MTRSSLNTTILMLFCVSLILARTGSHLHLCFDGVEQPVAMHFDDGGQHHEDADAGAGISVDHQDVDIFVAGSALTRLEILGVDLPALVILGLLLWTLVQTRQRFSPQRHRPFIPVSPRYARPPLRGPPLSFSH